MGSKEDDRTRSLLFFDACMPKMEECLIDNSCVHNTERLCLHRLRPNTEILGVSSYIDFLRFYDFQIILHFLYKIAQFRSASSLASDCKFYLVTKDIGFEKDGESGFLKSSQSEWEKRRHSHTVKFNFKKPYIHVEFNFNREKQQVDIRVITLKTKGRSAKDSLRELIAILNPPTRP